MADPVPGQRVRSNETSESKDNEERDKTAGPPKPTGLPHRQHTPDLDDMYVICRLDIPLMNMLGPPANFFSDGSRSSCAVDLRLC